MRYAGTTLAETVHLATRNPARIFGLGGRYGALAPGYAADLLLFRWDEESARLDVVTTVAAGRAVYQAEQSGGRE